MKGDMPMKIVIDRRPVVNVVSTKAAITQCIVGGVVGVASLVILYFMWKMDLNYIKILGKLMNVILNKKIILIN